MIKLYDFSKHLFEDREFCVDIIKGSKRLSELRGEKKISTVATDTLISSQSLRNYEEAGKEHPAGNRKYEFAGMSVDTLCKLSEYYKVTPEYILGIVDEKNPSIEVREIAKYTGLSETVISQLHYYIEKSDKEKESNL